MSEDADRANPKPPSVDRLSQLWRRISDHKVMQWTIAYVAVAYGIQHGVTLTREAFEWPQAVERVTMLLLILGLPVAITLAWYQGAQASRRFSAGECTIISLLLVGISILFYAFVEPSREGVAVSPAIQQASVTAARRAAADPHGAISIAVLPFANLSDEKEQEFFSDGMTDEISGALAKILDLRVVARQSAYRFKGEKQDARAIGQALGATHLLEGSVRKAGTRVRISAELVKADDGLRVWSENYDRDLTDVFAIQEDIARAIATSLRMPLGLKPGENLVNNRTQNEASYEAYLRAKALVRARSLQSVSDAVKLLEQAVARDPGFAPAWGLLGSAYRFIPQVDPARARGEADKARPIVEALLPKAEAAASRAIYLDPKNADGYRALGDVRQSQGKFLSAMDQYTQSLALDPNDADTLHTYADTLAELGYFKQAFPVRERVSALEPYVPVFNNNYGTELWAGGQTDAAIAMLKNPTAGPPGLGLATIYAAQGRYGEAADIMQSIRAPVGTAELYQASVQLLRAAPVSAASRQTLPQLGFLGLLYFFVGAPDRVLEYPEGNVKIGYFAALEVVRLWAPVFAPVRKTDRFKKFVRDAGFVDYWRAKGWPDLCRPIGPDDFVCD